MCGPPSRTTGRSPTCHPCQVGRTCADLASRSSRWRSPRSARRSPAGCWRPHDEATRSRPRASPPTSGIERKVDALLVEDDARREAPAAAAALATARSTTPTRAPASAASSASPTRRRSTTSSTSPSSSRGCTSRSCSPTTRSTATARSSRSRSARPAASTRPSRPPTTRSPRARRPRSASSRSTARWSTSRTSRAGAASPRARGEDPYLGSVFAAARVKGAQGSDYSAPDKVVTSVKHFAAYGQPEGGRDYNTTDMSEQRLRNLYLPPFKAAIDAGADTVMCSFNAINGVPGLRQPRTPRPTSSRSEWGFDGFIESDYTAVAELRACPPKTPDSGPVRPRRRRRRPGRRRAGAQRRHRLRDGQHEHPRLRQAAARASTRSRWRGSTTPCGGSCA